MKLGEAEKLALMKVSTARDAARERICRYQFQRVFTDLGLTAFYIQSAGDRDYFTELYSATTIGFDLYNHLPESIETPGLAGELDSMRDPLVRGPRCWDAWRADYEFTERQLDGLFTVLAQYDMRTLAAPETEQWSNTRWD